MATHPLLELNKLGQSVWLDNLSRPLVRSGELARLVAEDGITGVTSNPAIFRKAMTEGDAYDEAIARLAQEGRSTMEIYEALAITDIQDACDVLLPVYQHTEGRDGFISLEVSPLLAADTEGTVKEAARLWKAVDRSNLLIKIPGTPEGVPAVEACLARGINVNVTLLFSLEAHEAVIDAHIRARLNHAFDGFFMRSSHDHHKGRACLGHQFCFEVSAIHRLKISDDRCVWKTLTQNPYPVHTFGDN